MAVLDSLLHLYICLHIFYITYLQQLCNRGTILFIYFVVVTATLKNQRLVEQHQSQLSRSDHVVRELQSKESDWLETIRAKDAQLAVLRVRLDEVDKALRSKQSLIDSVQADRDR